MGQGVPAAVGDQVPSPRISIYNRLRYNTLNYVVTGLVTSRSDQECSHACRAPYSPACCVRVAVHRGAWIQTLTLTDGLYVVRTSVQCVGLYM